MAALAGPGVAGIRADRQGQPDGGELGPAAPGSGAGTAGFSAAPAGGAVGVPGAGDGRGLATRADEGQLVLGAEVVQVSYGPVEHSAAWDGQSGFSDVNR